MAEQHGVVEVVVSWDGAPLDSTTVRSQALRVGPSADAWFMVPPELLAADHTLVERGESGWVLSAPLTAELTVARGGRCVPAQEIPLASGVHRVALERGTSAQVRFGRLTFFVRAGEPAIEPLPKAGGDWRWTRWLGAAALLHAIVLGIFAMSPPAAGALNIDRDGAQTRYVAVRLDGVAREPEPAPVVASAGGTGAPSGSPGSTGGGEANRGQESSSPGPRRTDGRFQPHRTPTASEARTIGVLAVLARDPMSFGDESLPYTAGSALDGEGGRALNAAALLMPRGPGWGSIDLDGTGVGTCDPRRQDCTADTVDVGNLETRDPGGDGRDPGLRNRPAARAPEPVRDGHAETIGSLTREDVRRVVRRHMNEVRFCYEQGLQRRPDIEGRVAVSFVVSPNGVVQTASMTSTLADGEVGSCVVGAVQRWTFPEAQGATGVSYPFVMQPAD